MKKNGSLISVVVPVYKVEKYLKRCIDSILAQTYQNFEIILIDDESPDNCPQICDEYAKKYQNIKVIHQKNQSAGASEARNTGIKLSKGEYITFIDSDDYVHNSLLEVLINTLEDNKVNISMCSYNKIDDSFISKVDILDKKKIQRMSDYEAMNLLIEDQTTSAVWAKLYDINLFDGIRFPVGKHNEDMFISPILYLKAKQIAYNPMQLYHYNQEGESLCRADINLNMLDMVDAIKMWQLHTYSNYPKLTEKLDIHYFSTLLHKCQLIVISDKKLLKEKYDIYRIELLDNFKYIFISKHSTIYIKIKVLLMKIGLFDLVFKKINHKNKI